MSRGRAHPTPHHIHDVTHHTPRRTRCSARGERTERRLHTPSTTPATKIHHEDRYTRRCTGVAAMGVTTAVQAPLSRRASDMLTASPAQCHQPRGHLHASDAHTIQAPMATRPRLLLPRQVGTPSVRTRRPSALGCRPPRRCRRRRPRGGAARARAVCPGGGRGSTAPRPPNGWRVRGEDARVAALGGAEAAG